MTFLPLVIFRVYWRESCQNRWNLGFRLMHWMNVNSIMTSSPTLRTVSSPGREKNGHGSTCMRANTLRTDSSCQFQNQAVMNASCPCPVVRFRAHLRRGQWKLLIVPLPLLTCRLWLSVEFILLVLRSESCFLSQGNDAPSDRTHHSAPRRSNSANAGGQAASSPLRALHCETDVVLKVSVRICEVF